MHRTGSYLLRWAWLWRSFLYFPNVTHMCIHRHRKAEHRWYAAFCLYHLQWICALGSHGCCYHPSSRWWWRWMGRPNIQRWRKSPQTLPLSGRCLWSLSRISAAQPLAGRWMGLHREVSPHHFLVWAFSFRLLLVKESFWQHLVQGKVES